MTGHDPLLSTPQWKAVRLLVLDRDGWLCQIKGRRCKGYATEADHIVARADGGAPLDPANLRAACKPCNGGRGAERTNAMRRYRTSVPAYEIRL